MKIMLFSLLCIACCALYWGCDIDKPDEETGQTTTELHNLGIFWAQNDSDILVRIRGFRLLSGVGGVALTPTLSGVNIRASGQHLLIESFQETREVQLVDSGEIDVLNMSFIQWDEEQMCIDLHISHSK